jgi:choline dehydrogenase-like flavoprotein
MFLDARSIPAGEIIHTDICIVGGGAAGIAVALGLAGHAAQVVLLEAGGTTPRESTLDPYRGTISGRAYYPLDACRLRFLGGSTNFWGGWCHPLDAIDFEPRDWVPHSGWPFVREHLQPHYGRAQEICCLGPNDYDAGNWRRGPRRIANASPLTDIVFQVSPTRFGVEYRNQLRRTRNVTVALHASALELEVDANHRTATRIRAATLAGNRFAVGARVFVLAAGGIENPRILLASGRAANGGLGNEHDLVGRFFSDHLHVQAGTIHLHRRRATFYQTHRTKGITIRGGLSLTERARRQDRLLGCGLTLHDAADPHDVLAPAVQPAGYDSLRYLVQSARRGERPERLWRHVGNVVAGMDDAARLSYHRLVKRAARRLVVGLRLEQAPNPDSRITLDEEADCFGLPRARLHWQLTAQDVDSFIHVQRLWPAELAQAGVIVTPLAGTAEQWSERLVAAAHHIGTTRMHRDPRRGVVDEHCRVHGSGNVYVAGSSVFPTAGWAPPTLTIVALAMRLAEHLKARLAN